MSDSTVFIAVDFGTAFSGYCFKFAGSEQICEPKWGKEYGFNTPKTPTCILFDENEKFLEFGYDAVMTYTRQTQKDDAKKLYLFDNFKMELHGKELHRDIMITSKNGKQIKAMKVFSESLRFMKDHALEMIGKKYSASDATWILTVPAIWSEAAKQFMREAATEAGLMTEAEPKRLIIALESEAASVWCRQLPSEGFMEGDLRGSEKIEVVPGTQYMVVDCGGGIVNITVHETVKGGDLKELFSVYENNMNGQTVNKNIEAFLRELLMEVFNEFNKEHASNLQRLVYACNADLPRFYNTKVEYFQELFRKVNDTGAYSKKNPDWEQKLGAKMASFYDDSLKNIESLIKEALKNPNLNISYIFLVGGFALSPYVNSFIRERFRRRYKVLCPADAQMAVLRGAVTFGMRQNVVESRISRYSYGIRIAEEFDQAKHRGKHKYGTKEGKVYCDVCFHCFVQKDESVLFDEVREFNFNPIERDQKHVQFDLYYTESKSARFVDERGMVKIGSLTISMPVIKSGSPRRLKLQVKFGCPEMQATVRDLNTGEIGSVKLDIMSK
uniref:Heat shock 70 kDa protein 12A-like n=1 Tax=Astyanax mexicanus TaxID=7994 RepID=W5L073_ASTMX